METRLTVLQLVMNGMGLESGIDTIDERVTFQKAVYLAQAGGVQLGYRYNWYRMGPYSPDLTRDYYALHETSDDEPTVENGMSLRPQVIKTLQTLSSILSPPPDFPHNQAGWLELLASVHYLMVGARMDVSNTKSRLEDSKPMLSPHTDLAIQRLQEAGMITS